MWQEWLSGVLGLWVILLALLSGNGLSGVVLLVTGTTVAILGFWGGLDHRNFKAPHEHKVSYL